MNLALKTAPVSRALLSPYGRKWVRSDKTVRAMMPALTDRLNWVRSDKKALIAEFSGLRCLEWSRFLSTSYVWYLKLARRTPALGVGETFIAVQSRQPLQVLKTARRQLDCRHQFRADGADS